MRQYLEQELIDELAVFIAPILTGGSKFGFGLGDHLQRSSFLETPTIQTFGVDTLIRGNLKPYKHQ